METFLNRYRNLSVLLLVIFAQLVLLAVQVKNDQDVRMIRVWTVTAVTPAARIVEWMRGSSVGFVRDYILLHDTHDENRRLQSQVDRLKLENNFLKNQLNTADRAQALRVFQEHTQSKTLAANVIGTGAGTNSKIVFVDRGSVSGVQRGMAVVSPDGIVGKITAAYPTASEVLLITDPDFAAGVISQKTQVRGTLKGQGKPLCFVDYVPIQEKLEVGDWFYTSGDDRVFPRGFPVGIVKVVGTTVRNGQSVKDIQVEPSGLQRGLEDVLILIEAVHQTIPDLPVATQPVYIAPAPPAGEEQAAAPQPSSGTDADKLRAQYKAIGDAQNHKFGEGLPGSKPPDFNMKLPPAGTAPAQPQAGVATPGAQAPNPPRPAPAGGSPTATPSVKPPSPAPTPAAAPPQPTQAPKAQPPAVKPPSAKAPPSDLSVAERPHSE